MGLENFDIQLLRVHNTTNLYDFLVIIAVSVKMTKKS